jgi:ribosomal protein S18 acetylase RimI-like enzyme
MQVASLGFTTDLMVRQMEGSSLADQGDYIVVRTPANPAYYWGNFVLAGADVADHERWLAVFAREFPGAQHVAIGLDGGAPSDEALAGYRAAGMEAEFEQVLVATHMDVPAPPLRAACRPLRSDDDWAQALELNQDCAERTDDEHRLFIRMRTGQQRELSRLGRAVWFGAFVDDRVRSSLGLVSNGPGLARYQHVETHPDFRRRGLARTLVATAGRYGLGELGARKLVIIADLGYHAIDLYRSLGFADADTQVSLLRSPQPG